MPRSRPGLRTKRHGERQESKRYRDVTLFGFANKGFGAPHFEYFLFVAGLDILGGYCHCRLGHRRTDCFRFLSLVDVTYDIRVCSPTQIRPPTGCSLSTASMMCHLHRPVVKADIILSDLYKVCRDGNSIKINQYVRETVGFNWMSPHSSHLTSLTRCAEK